MASLGDLTVGLVADASSFISSMQNAMRVMESVFKVAEEGARNQAAQRFFENAGKSIEEYRVATKGMISDVELMKKANLADSMGITTETFKTLAGVANASALKTGQSFDYMFNSIIVGTARSSRLLLDNLGIIVSVDAANRRYAKAQLELAGDTSVTTKEINKFVKAMDDAEKKTAFTNEVMLQSKETMVEFAKIGETSATKFAGLEAAINNFKDALKASLAEAVVPAVPAITDFVQGIDNLLRRGKPLEAFGAVLNEVGKALIYTGSFGQINLKGNSQIDQGNLQKMKDKNVELGVVGEWKTIIEDQIGPLQDFEKVVQQYVDSSSMGVSELDKSIAQFLKLNTMVGNAFGEFKRTVVKAPKKPAEAKKETRSERKIFMDEDILGVAEELRLAEANRVESARVLELQKMEGVALAAFITKTNAAARALEEMRKVAKDKLRLDDLDQKNAEQALRQKRGEELTGSSMSAISGGLGAAGGLFQAIAGPAVSGMGAAMAPMVGAMAGPIGALIGMIIQLVMELDPVIKIVADLMQGLGLLVENAVGPLLTALMPLGPALMKLLASVGLLIGFAVAPVTNALNALIPVIAFVIDMFTLVITVLSPFVGIIFEMLFWFLKIIDVFAFMTNGAGAAQAFAAILEFASNQMLDGAIYFVNGMVNLIRNIPGMSTFGTLISRSDFGGEPAPEVEANTAAVTANTQAIRNFTQELHNLPQGYKVASATYASTSSSSATAPRSTASRPTVYDRETGRPKF